MEKEIGVKSGERRENQDQEEIGERQPSLRLFPSAPGDGAQPLRIPRAGRDEPPAAGDSAPAWAAREKHRGFHHRPPHLWGFGWYSRLAMVTVRKEDNAGELYTASCCWHSAIMVIK